MRLLAPSRSSMEVSTAAGSARSMLSSSSAILPRKEDESGNLAAVNKSSSFVRRRCSRPPEFVYRYYYFVFQFHTFASVVSRANTAWLLLGGFRIHRQRDRSPKTMGARAPRLVVIAFLGLLQASARSGHRAAKQSFLFSNSHFFWCRWGARQLLASSPSSHQMGSNCS